HLPNGQKRPRLRALLLQHQPSPLEQLERRDAIECVDGTAPQCKCDRRRPELAEHPDLGSGPRPDVFDNPTSLCTSRLVPDKCARACTRARHSIRGGEPSSPSQSRNPLRQHSPVSLVESGYHANVRSVLTRAGQSSLSFRKLLAACIVAPLHASSKFVREQYLERARKSKPKQRFAQPVALRLCRSVSR